MSSQMGKPDIAGQSFPCRRVRMDKAGRLVMPSDVRKALNLDGEQELLISLEDGCVRLRTIDEGLSRVREIAKRKRKRQGSMVDEFIAERRAESLRD